MFRNSLEIDVNQWERTREIKEKQNVNSAFVCVFLFNRTTICILTPTFTTEIKRRKYRICK